MWFEGAVGARPNHEQQLLRELDERLEDLTAQLAFKNSAIGELRESLGRLGGSLGGGPASLGAHRGAGSGNRLGPSRVPFSSSSPSLAGRREPPLAPPA